MATLAHAHEVFDNSHILSIYIDVPSDVQREVQYGTHDFEPEYLILSAHMGFLKIQLDIYVPELPYLNLKEFS